MTRLEKRIERMRRRPPHADFRDVRRVLEAFGWTLDRMVGSHHHFVKPGELPLTIPTVAGRRVRRVYLDVICERLGLEE